MTPPKKAHADISPERVFASMIAGLPEFGLEISELDTIGERVEGLKRRPAYSWVQLKRGQRKEGPPYEVVYEQSKRLLDRELVTAIRELYARYQKGLPLIDSGSSEAALLKGQFQQYLDEGRGLLQKIAKGTMGPKAFNSYEHVPLQNKHIWLAYAHHVFEKNKDFLSKENREKLEDFKKFIWQTRADNEKERINSAAYINPRLSKKKAGIFGILYGLKTVDSLVEKMGDRFIKINEGILNHKYAPKVLPLYASADSETLSNKDKKRLKKYLENDFLLPLSDFAINDVLRATLFLPPKQEEDFREERYDIKTFFSILKDVKLECAVIEKKLPRFEATKLDRLEKGTKDLKYEKYVLQLVKPPEKSFNMDLHASNLNDYFDYLFGKEGYLRFKKERKIPEQLKSEIEKLFHGAAEKPVRPTYLDEFKSLTPSFPDSGEEPRGSQMIGNSLKKSEKQYKYLRGFERFILNESFQGTFLRNNNKKHPAGIGDLVEKISAGKLSRETLNKLRGSVSPFAEYLAEQFVEMHLAYLNFISRSHPNQVFHDDKLNTRSEALEERVKLQDFFGSFSGMKPLLDKVFFSPQQKSDSAEHRRQQARRYRNLANAVEKLYNQVGYLSKKGYEIAITYHNFKNLLKPSGLQTGKSCCEAREMNKLPVSAYVGVLRSIDKYGDEISEKIGKVKPLLRDFYKRMRFFNARFGQKVANIFLWQIEADNVDLEHGEDKKIRDNISRMVSEVKKVAQAYKSLGEQYRGILSQDSLDRMALLHDEFSKDWELAREQIGKKYGLDIGDYASFLKP